MIDIVARGASPRRTGAQLEARHANGRLRLRLLRGLLHERLLLSRCRRAGAGPIGLGSAHQGEGEIVISERAEILKTMRAGPLILARLVRDLDDGALRARPEAGEWAIVEVVAHLADTEDRALGRMRAMLTEHEPLLPAYDPDALAAERDYRSADLSAELTHFEKLRTEQAELLAGLADDQWQRAGRHEEHGVITVQQLAAHTAGEDADHFAQIARMIPA